MVPDAGTKAGEPWYWNVICEDEVYYHIDLLECERMGQFQTRTGEEMSGYVWDYSAYPMSGLERESTDTTNTDMTVPTEPPQTGEPSEPEETNEQFTDPTDNTIPTEVPDPTEPSA